MSSNFLSSINQTIGDNMRFVRDFQANPEKYARQSSGSSGSSSSQITDDWSQMLNPIIMLMMFQMMMKIMTQLGVGLPQGNYVPVTEPWGGNVHNNTGGNPSITQNPAVQYFENRFQTLLEADPDAEEIPWGNEEIEKLRGEIAEGKLTLTQVGQALMYELDKTSPENLPAVGKTIAALMESGELNIVPFLQNDYLSQLDEDRRALLLSAVELSGLRLEDGQPNSRFVAFLLENLSRENPNKADQPYTQALVRQFMQDFYDVHGRDPSTPVGSTLAQIISLTGITTDDEGQLVFP